MEITIYTTPICPYCIRAKNLLKKKGLEYREINVAFDAEMRNWLVQKTGQRTVPQIFFDQEYIGNCDEIHRKERTGELDRLLGKA
ncbi:MAG: glutaredoxin 3 [Acidobacteria bacterium]|nr:glutaredoxin 3 [Acidobacteriota bacterium]